jgi:hypothetical protein
MLQATPYERTSAESDRIDETIPDGHTARRVSLSQTKHRID